ncbi:cdc42 effector protein 5 [Pygocentrus nattereri]|uniref:CRIB domain-containing protein n=1 Tax=Pygocentrus nattereri TaxID=42514 RepID=A0A3B4E654_PYGNA|nr:cdc42 effector protein 5 [Pygocentrus nattereri]
MPLHKSGRAHRLDPTMISAPLGDFRHTMHIGRGGDAFGDTSFLSNCGPSKTESVKSKSDSLDSVPSPTATTIDPPEMRLSHDGDDVVTSDEAHPQLRHSESVSSFDLDLDLGPSILGDVLGVMDGLGLGSDWTTGKQGEEVFGSSADGGMSPIGMADELNEVNGVKSKGLRPKVRFSDKKEEIIGRQFGIGGGSEAEVEKEREMSPVGVAVQMRVEETTNKEMAYRAVAESTNHRGDHSPSPSSSMSSEYEGVSPLDRRREEESVSEEECAAGEQGYTFEDESDDEIGL